jgi:uncharacterized protein (DUF1800 family)
MHPGLSTIVKCAAAAAIALLAATALAAPFGPDRVMDAAAARGMLTRFGYGATPASLDAAMKETPRQYLDRAIREGVRLPASIAEQIAALPIAQPVEAVWARLGPGGSARVARDDEEARKAMQKEEREFASAAVQARLLSMANADNQGREALLSFWLNHFSIFAPNGVAKLLAWDYVRAVEQAMRADSFEALLRASFYHPAMQIYLENNQSTAGDSQLARQAAERGKQLGINENLARELLELHTLGVDGGYTQKDVQELARIITGAGAYAPQMQEKALARAGATRAGLFLFDPRRHDFGEKTLLGSRFPAGQGMAEVDAALHLLATHPATARHLAFKLAQRFLDDEPPREIVDAMAAAFRASGGKISATLGPLIDSPAFAASLARPAKFKEPVDFLLSVARAACGDQPVGNRIVLAAHALDMGQAPLMRSTPDGYGARETDWLSPAAMAKRVRLAIGVAGERVPFARGDDARIPGARQMIALAESERPALSRGTPCTVNMNWLESLVEPLSPTTRASAARLPPRDKAAALLASPEFMRH